MVKPGSQTNKRKSLRFQYTLIASIVCGVLILASLLSDLYIDKLTSENTSALNLHNTIYTHVDELENAIWKSDKSLYLLLTNNKKIAEDEIIANLDEVNKQLINIKTISDFSHTALASHITSLVKKQKKLKDDVLTLLELRKDENWIYPMLPFFNATLLDSNNHFETAINLAIKETLNSGVQGNNRKVFTLLDEIRNIWRLKILDFRGALLRYAGLNIRNISQEKNIETFQKILDEKLQLLVKFREKGELGLETEIALDELIKNSKKWYKDYHELLKIKKSNVWRADVKYLHTIIQPQQKSIFDELNIFKKELNKWAFINIQRVEKVAEQINYEFWILTFIAVLFTIYIYRMLARSLLIPIANISNSIKRQNSIPGEIEVPVTGSEEIYTLISTFNEMRDQVNHRQMVLEFQAMHDALTGLPNRALLQDRLEQGIQLASRNKNTIALLLLDLDRFKEINDTLGHPVGDSVLRELSRRLEKFLRSSDTVARLGGDEFAIITNYKDREQIDLFVEKIVHEVEKVIVIDERQLYVGVSVGIATYPQHGEDADTLIRRADIAMYSAKRENKNHEFYDNDKDYHSAENLALLADLKSELKKPADQIQLHFQPIIDIASSQVIGAEALIRWEHPTLGMMSADHIITMAEQTGLISDLTYWVLNESLHCYSEWKNDNIRVSVNLSAINLHDPELIPFLSKKLEEVNVNPEKLTLEITESAVMNDPIMAQKVLTELKDMGITLVIDDYGTGLSSLAYLKSLPVKCLKIDKSFVMEMRSNENDSIIIHSTIDMAHNLGLTVVAEGVENSETLESLRKLNCDYMQGFYVAAPMSSGNFMTWMDNYSPEVAI